MSNYGFHSQIHVLIIGEPSLIGSSLKPNQDSGVAEEILLAPEKATIPALKEKIIACINQLHTKYHTLRFHTSGSTMSVCMVLPDGQYLAAYIGDSPIYKAKREGGCWSVTMLNQDKLHVLDPKTYTADNGGTALECGDEKQRFSADYYPPDVTGLPTGLVRVANFDHSMNIAMTRVIGDYCLEGFLTHTPSFIEGAITPDEDAIFFSASDGVSDVLSPADLNTILNDSSVSLSIQDSLFNAVASTIVERAKAAWGRSPLSAGRGGYSDDITVSMLHYSPSAPSPEGLISVQMALIFDGHGDFGDTFSQGCLRQFQKEISNAHAEIAAVESREDALSTNSYAEGGGAGELAERLASDFEGPTFELLPQPADTQSSSAPQPPGDPYAVFPFSRQPLAGLTQVWPPQAAAWATTGGGGDSSGRAAEPDF